MTRLHSLASAIAVVAATTVAGTWAESVTVELELHSTSDQTNVYRVDITECGLEVIRGVTVLDSARGGGSDGVYSGSDIDFVLLDQDGALQTADDRIAPLENADTRVGIGAVRNGENSGFQPTADHPGVLFGLKADGTIDFSTATPALPDARYTDLNPDSTSGWVSIGDEGLLQAAFEPVRVRDFSRLYLLVGEVGIGSGEALVAILKGD